MHRQQHLNSALKTLSSFLALLLIGGLFLTATTTTSAFAAGVTHLPAQPNNSSKSLVSVSVPVVLGAVLGGSSLVVTGTAQANSTVTLFDGNGNQLGTTVADANGNFSFTDNNTSGIVAGTTTVAAQATVCVLSNCVNSALSLPLTVTTTTSATPTTTPIVTVNIPVVVSAVLGANGLVITGTAQPNATVKLYDGNGNLLGTVTADGNGLFSLTDGNTSDIVAGTTTVAAKATVCVANVCVDSGLSLPITVTGNLPTNTPTPPATTTTPAPTGTPTPTNGGGTTPTPTPTNGGGTTPTPAPTTTAAPTGTPTPTNGGGGTPTPTPPSNGGGNGGNSSYTYYLPYLANNAAGIGGNYTTNLSVQNMTNSAASFVINYYDANGNAMTTAGSNNIALAPNNKWVASSMALGQWGAATIVSNQPLAIVVSETGTFNGATVASSYPAINSATGVGSSIYAPIALNNSYGGYSTGLMLKNTGSSDTVVTVQYYNDFGNPAGSQNVTIKAQNTTQVMQNDANSPLTSNFSGWAVITSSNGQGLAGMVVETNPVSGFVATVACTAVPGNKVYIPVVFQNAFGNFMTGMQLVNPNGTPANVTVQIYRKDGTLMQLNSAHASFQMPAHSDKSFYHATSVFPELLTANGGFVGTAIITSDQPLLSMVNQAGSLGGVNFNGSFGTILSGAAQVEMPTVQKDASAYSSGLQIVNTSSTASTATITFYDMNGNKVYQSKLTADDGGPIKPGGSINPYQGTDSNLPDGFDGTAVISADTSGANFVVVGNISNAKIFYTYAEPN